MHKRLQPISHFLVQLRTKYDNYERKGSVGKLIQAICSKLYQIFIRAHVLCTEHYNFQMYYTCTSEQYVLLDFGNHKHEYEFSTSTCLNKQLNYC